VRFLITAGPTREPIDPVRYIGNRSSGKMGAAMASAAARAGHEVQMIVGPVSVPMPTDVDLITIESSSDLETAVIANFPTADILIMAAAVADYRPIFVSPTKLGRGESLTLELEPVPDIVATTAASKKPHQRVVAFSLEQAGNIDRAREKMLRKGVDLMVFNPTDTMNSDVINAILLYPDGRIENLPSRTKVQFADVLIERAVALT